MNLLQDIPAANEDMSVVNIAVAIPKGSRNKYEFDENTGAIWLDRVGYSSSGYPVDYGDVPQTLGEDGDALDALVIVTEPTYPGIMVRGKVIGVLHMVDDGEVDDKILCVPDDDPRLSHIDDLSQVSQGVLNEISHFFATYKQLQNKEVTITGWKDRAAAKQVIEAAMKRYADHILDNQ